jgi:hypothetical protein
MADRDRARGAKICLGDIEPMSFQNPNSFDRVENATASSSCRVAVSYRQTYDGFRSVSARPKIANRLVSESERVPHWLSASNVISATSVADAIRSNSARQ